MEQAANAELEKLEVSKKLANALLDEEGAFKAVGIAAEKSEKKTTSGKTRQQNQQADNEYDSSFKPIINVNEVNFNPTNEAELKNQLQDYLDKVSKDTGFKTTDLDIKFDENNESARAVATFKNEIGDVVRQVYGIKSASEEAEESVKQLIYLGGNFKTSFEIQKDVEDKNSAFIEKLKSSLKDVKQKAYDMSKSLKDTTSFDEMEKSINDFDNKIAGIVDDSVGEYSQTIKAQLGEVVKEIDRTRQALQQKEYPAQKLSANSFDNSIKENISALMQQDNEWKKNGITVDGFRQKVEDLYNKLNDDSIKNQKGLKDWASEFATLKKQASEY